MEIISAKFTTYPKEKKNSKPAVLKEEKKIMKDLSTPKKEKENQQEVSNNSNTMQNFLENRKKWLQVIEN